MWAAHGDILQRRKQEGTSDWRSWKRPLSQRSKADVSSGQAPRPSVPSRWCGEHGASLWSSSPVTQGPRGLSGDKHQINTNRGASYEIAVLLKTAKIIKSRKVWETASQRRLMTQLNIMWYPGIPKGHRVKTEEIWINCGLWLREGGNENHHFTLKLVPLLTKTWKTISSFLCFPSFYLIACIYTFRITVHRAHNLNVLLMEAPDLIRKSHWLHYFKFNQTWVNLARELKESSRHALSSSKILEKYFNWLCLLPILWTPGLLTVCGG